MVLRLRKKICHAVTRKRTSTLVFNFRVTISLKSAQHTPRAKDEAYRKLKSRLRKPSRTKLFALFFFLFILFLSFIGVYVIANFFDWKVPIFNPPDQTYTITMPFWYPNIPAGGGIYFDREIYGAIFLTYAGTLAEGAPVEMEVEATATNTFAQNITFIVVSFGGANLVPTKGPASAWYIEEYFQGTILSRTNTHPKYLGIYEDVVFEGQRSMTWLTEGNYYPTVTVHYNDSTTVEESLQDYTIHVNSSDAIRQEEYNRVNTTLSVALFAFAVVGSIEVMNKIWKWRQGSIRSQGYEDYA